MKIIKLEDYRNVKIDLTLQQKFASNEKIIFKKFDFICTNCKTIHSFEITNGLFRTLDYYCNNCGQRHKITNPAFGTDNKIKKS